MAFTSHELAAAGPSGQQEDGQYSFTVVWRLFASLGTDGPDAALDYVEANIAQRKDTYALEATPTSSSPSGSVDSNSRAELKTVKVDREKGSADPWVWLATLTYEEPEGGGDGEKPDGSNTGDPTEFAAEVEISTVQLQKFATKALYKSGFSGIAKTKVNDSTKRPIVNSALCVYDPPPEVDDHRFVIRIKKNVATLDCDTIRCNVVNSSAVSISYRGISKTIHALGGKTRDITATPVKHPVIGWYVQVQVYIDVLPSDETWRIKVQDRGFSARAMIGDPDGHGGAIYNDSRAFVTDLAPQRRLTDSEGMPCSEPQLLNGDGQPLLDFTKTTGAVTPVYSEWQYYTEEDFGAWAILTDLIGSESSS